jgi:hypothetical protein
VTSTRTGPGQQCRAPLGSRGGGEPPTYDRMATPTPPPSVATTLLHPVYLPFSEDVVRRHFADVIGGGDPDRHLSYYRTRLAAAAELAAHRDAGSPVTRAMVHKGRQMEKDERFWVVSALLSVWYGDDPKGGLVRLLQRCFGSVPAVAVRSGEPAVGSWEQLLAGELHLYFEANLPSPPSYKEALKHRLDEVIVVRYVREAAEASSHALEGATKVDAVVVAPGTGFAVIFEAKVQADISTGVTYDVLRNQLARTIDVALDPNPKLAFPLSQRRPERTFVALITPQVFRDHPTSRLYGWLMRSYQESSADLQGHLPHRTADQVEGVRHRLGWTTWEELELLTPGACRWLHHRGSPDGVPSDVVDPPQELEGGDEQMSA